MMERATPRAGFFPLVSVLLLAFSAAGCWPDETPTGSVSQCATSLFPTYNPKDKDQCIAACMKCERGVMTTCATSCSLKGAK
jgi:hypothetical protein